MSNDCILVCGYQVHVYWLSHVTEQVWALLSCIPYFCPQGMEEWNQHPLPLRSSNSLLPFKKRLKTHYFFLAFKESES